MTSKGNWERSWCSSAISSDLALSLLGALLCLSLQAGDLVAQLGDGVVAILHLEVESGLRFGKSLGASFSQSGCDAFLGRRA